MNRLNLPSLFFIFLAVQTYAQDFQWAIHNAGIGDDRGIGIDTDSLGNVYGTGLFTGTIDLDPGPDTHYESAIGNNIYVQKLDNSGNFIWGIQFNGSDDGIGKDVYVNSENNVYCIGNIEGPFDFDASPETFILAPALDKTIFITELSEDGDFLWAKRIEGPGNAEVFRTVMDDEDNLYLSGRFFGTVDFDPGPETHYLTEMGGYDAFVLKLDSEGNFLWVKHMHGEDGGGSILTNSIALDNDENIFLTGTYSGDVDFDPGLGVATLPGNNVFVLKLNHVGDFQWVGELGGAYSDKGLAIAADSEGSVYSTGYFYGTGDFDPGPETYELNSTHGFDQDVYISKLDADGNFVWAKTIDSSSDYDRGQSIHVDENDRIYVGGKIEDGVFAYTLDKSGHYNCTSVFSGSDGAAYSAVADRFGNVFTTGYFDDSMDFDPSEDDFVLTTIGDWTDRDIYITKLGACFDTGSDLVIDTCGTYTVPSGDETYGPGSFYSSIKDTLISETGHDSILWIDLRINTYGSTIFDTICNGSEYTVPSGDETYTISGVYKDTIPTVSGCDSILTIILTRIVANMNITTFDPGLTSSASGDVAYQWLDCDADFELIIGATNQNFIPDETGNYTVEITKEGCIDTADCHYYLDLGLDDSKILNNLLVYPNPSEGNFTIEFSQLMNTIDLVLTDVSGRIVLNNNYSETDKIDLDLNAEKGTYFAYITANGREEIMIKLIKN